MNDEQLAAWLAQHGGEVGRSDNEQEVDDPTDTGPKLAGEKKRQIKTIDSTTVTAKDGATVKLRRLPGPAGTGDIPAYQVVEQTPAKPASATSQEPPKEEPNPNDPTRMRRYNPTTKAWEDAGVNQAEVDRRARQATQDQNTAAAQGRADASQTRQDRRLDDAEARAAAMGSRIVVKDQLYEKGADGKWAPVTPKPAEIQKGAGKNGEDVQAVYDPKTGTYSYQPVTGAATPSPYTDVKQDPDSKKWYGLTRTGKWEEMPGGPGALTGPQTAGPPMPQIILGHSQDALKEYGAKLDALVASGAITPADRVRRFNEALQVAQQVVNEATLQQRSDESNLNASVNLANSRLSASTTGFGQALTFAQNMNGWLPKNSSLGGEAFAALLGLQLAQAQKMGAYGNIVPGAAQPSQATGRGIADAAPAATAQTDAQITRLTQPQAAPAPAAAVPPPAPDQAAAPPVAPAAPVAPPAINPATGEPTGLAPLPNTPASTPPPTAGEPGGPPLQNGPTNNPADQRPAAMSQQIPNGAERPDDIVTIANSAGQTITVRRATWDSDPAIRAGNRVVNAVPNPNGPDGGARTAQAAPQDDFAVLRNTPSAVPLDPSTPQPTLVQTQIPPPQSGQQDATMPAALLHTQARITPPWQIDEQTYQRMKAAGVPDEVIFSTPGRAAA